MLTLQFADYAVNKFFEEIESRMNMKIDTVLMSENYEFIAGTIDEEDMNALNMAQMEPLLVQMQVQKLLKIICTKLLACRY